MELPGTVSGAAVSAGDAGVGAAAAAVASSTGATARGECVRSRIRCGDDGAEGGDGEGHAQNPHDGQCRQSSL